MHILFYSFAENDDSIVVLTNREFKQALVSWQINTSYFCERLQSLCPPPPALKLTKKRNDYYLVADSSIDESEIIYLKREGRLIKCDKKNNASQYINFDNKDQEEAFMDKLVTEDEYYDNLKLIK